MNDIIKCYSCNNEDFITYSYDYHVFKFNFKYLIKKLLKDIDFLIPNFSVFKKIKRISSNTFNVLIVVLEKLLINPQILSLESIMKIFIGHHIETKVQNLMTII